MPSKVTVLNTPVMAAREAARQLRMPPATLVHWLEGGVRRGKQYDPVLRPEPLGSTEITWGEFVEARYLRAYRSELGVSLQRLRPFISRLRAEFDVPYPLAHFRPYIDSNRRLLLELQEEANLPQSLWVVYEVKTGQTILNPLLKDDFLARVEFSDHGDLEAERFRPHGPGTPVVLDPLISSAAATVRGIRTEVLAEQVGAGESIDDVAEDFDLPVTDVRAAVAHEWDESAA